MKTRILFLKGGLPNAPGLTRKLVTGKDGVQRIQWVKQPLASKTVHNDAQTELFDATGTPYATLETRPNTTNKQKQAGSNAFAALERRVNLLRDSGGSAATLLGSRLCKDFKASGGSQLIGQQVNSPADLAVLAQVYRDPRFETFRAIFTKEGEVVGEAAYSSRLPGQVQLPKDIDQALAKDVKRFGADGLYILHNHPSGSAYPSDADIRLTQHIAKNIPQFIQHVVIDHNEYATIDHKGACIMTKDARLEGMDYHATPAVDHPLLGVKLATPKDVALAAKAMQQMNELGAPVLIMTKGGESKVELIATVPSALTLQLGEKTARAKAWLRGIGRASGAGSNRFLLVSDSDYASNEKTNGSLIHEGLVTDVVSADGKSMAEAGYWSKVGFNAALFDTRRDGRKVAEPEGEQGETDFIKAPDGSIDFGEITPEMSKAMRRQPGKIRLTYGVQNLDGTGYGLIHIEARHGDEIRSSGFKSVKEFVLDAVRHIDAIWMPNKTSQIIAVQAGGKGKVMFLKIEQTIEKDEEYYRINSAFPSSDKYINRKERKEGWKALWSRYPVSAVTSGATGFADQSPKAGETTPTVSPQSGELNIPLMIKKSNGDTPMQSNFSKALGNIRILFFKSHIKQFTRKDGTIVKEHDDKRQKMMQAAPVARAPAKQEEASQQQPKAPEEAGKYGHHNVNEGDNLSFKAGEFAGSGKVKSVGRDGATVTDKSGRDHSVHWHEVQGRGEAGEAKETAPNKEVDPAKEGKAETPEAAKPADGKKKKFFDPAETEALPHKDTVGQTVFKSWDEAAKIGPQALTEYNGLLENLSKACGFETGKGSPDDMTPEALDNDTSYLFMGPMKQQAKSSRKVEVDYKGDWTKLKDLVRATIAVKSIDDVHATLAGLKEAGLEFAQKPKDNMTGGTKDGYRDLNLILKLPETGMLVELQIAVKQISKVKGDAHHYYNENVALDQKRKEQLTGGGNGQSVKEPGAMYGREDEDKEANWPDKGDYQKFMSNRKKQNEIYGSAWAKVPGIEQILKALRWANGNIRILFKRR